MNIYNRVATKFNFDNKLALIELDFNAKSNNSLSIKTEENFLLKLKLQT